jgi:Ca2+-binding EF-hand superfamily protein
MMFRMFDFDNSGKVNYPEFQEVLRALIIDPSVRLPISGGVIDSFFGANHDKELSTQKFLSFIAKIRKEVALAEFKQYDEDNSGYISNENFCKLVTASILGSHLPFYIVENIRKLQGSSAKRGVSLHSWNTFNFIMSISYDLEKAIQMFCMCGYPLTRNDFARAVHAVSGIHLDKEAVEMVFTVFDRDGDGHLEYDEFLALCRSKRSFNSTEKPPGDGVQRNLVQGLFKCAQDAFHSIKTRENSFT